WLLRLSWGPTELPVMDHVSAVFPDAVGSGRVPVPGSQAAGPAWSRADGQRTARRMLIGSLDDVTGRVLGLPARRWVVLGARGSGKSSLAVQLVLGLLDRRADIGDRVPVLLPACAWDPTAQTFTEWLERWLAEEYFEGRSRLPRRLLEGNRILPILDGLD